MRVQNAEQQCKLQNQTKDNADVSKQVAPMTLQDARAAAQELKIFVQENHCTEAVHQCLEPIQALSREMGAMTVFA